MSWHNWKLIAWFSRAWLSKGSIKEYLKEVDFGTKGQEETKVFKTYANLKQAWYNILYRILED